MYMLHSKNYGELHAKDKVRITSTLSGIMESEGFLVTAIFKVLEKVGDILTGW